MHVTCRDFAPVLALVCGLFFALASPSSGQCTVDLDCNDTVACTVDTCTNPGPAGVCSNVATDGLCDNGLFCDGVETCDALLDCQVGTAVDCADAVGCTVDACDEVNDVCVNTAVDALCDNALFCDGVETCDAVLDCLSGVAVDCTDVVGCTVDTCDEVNDVCVNTATDSLCDNGLFCDGAETCDALLDCQVGVAVDCTDVVGCTVDTCDEVNDVCVNTATDSLCDNAVFCDGAETCDAVLDCQVGADPCPGQLCDEVGAVCADCFVDLDCDDALFCNGLETCLAGVCQPGVAVNCADAVGCTVDTCDEVNDVCVNTSTDALCDNGLFCDGVETCDALLDCQAGVAVDCADVVACTVDSCDEVNDVCLNTATDSLCDNAVFCDGVETCDAVLDCQVGADPCPGQLCDELGTVCVDCLVDLDCDDALFCNGLETCLAGVCQPGLAVNCADAVGCTVDSCDEVNDVCANTPVDILCDNGLFCDGVETCDALLDCQAGVTVDCTDAVACTVDSCDEVNDVCVNTATDSLCDNAVFCDGAETCDVLLDCQVGGDPCPGQSCDEVGTTCVDCFVDLDCDDGLFCTGVETCLAGVCQAGTPVDCADAVGCTVDSCDEVNDVCANTPVDILCSNGLFCDGAETCDALLDCQAGTAVDCNDTVGCTADSCDEVNDVCQSIASDALCDNGLFCDGAETCDALLDCQAGAPVDCADTVACTADSCDEVNDVCAHATTDSLCDNGLFCDGAETCHVAFGCQAGPAIVCNDGIVCTADSCNETTDSCGFLPVNVLCSNGVFCDGVEVCDLVLGCSPGAPVTCTDGIGCTVDTCIELSNSCQSAPVDALCDNGLFCDGLETCDALLDCQAGTAVNCDDAVGCTADSCDDVNDVCVNSPVDLNCDNGLFCDGVEVCSVAFDCQPGPAVVCDDVVGCTVDSCDEFNDVCVNIATDSLCDNSQFCDGSETCDALLDCQTGTPVVCDDGVVCTIDTCDEVADVCASMADNTACDNGLFCDGAETCDILLGCQAAAAIPCDDGLNCTVDSCDEVGNACVHATIPGCQNCFINADCNDSIGCTLDTCVAGDCVNTPSHVLCSNGLFCDGDEVCDVTLDCRAGPPRDCGDGIACTTDGCDETFDACLHTANDSLCTNGQFCDGVETCDVLLGCRSGTDPCEDSIPCTANACNDLTNTCVTVPIDTFCDNGVFCDGTEVCHPLFGCESGGSQCDDGIDCTVDTCNEVVSSCTNTPVDDLCDDGDPTNGGEICDPNQGCVPGPLPILAHVVPIVLQSPSGLDSTMGSPPLGVTRVEEGMPFVVEMWAQQPMQSTNPPLGGICCAFADFDFNPSLMDCTGVSPSPLYSGFSSGTCGVGVVDELGGCTFTILQGITPEWVRVATVIMSANLASAENIVSSAPGTTTMSICQFGTVPVDQIAFGSTRPFNIGNPCIYDLDADDCITSGDLAFFAPCWLLTSADPEWAAFGCAASDFDCSGGVNTGDLAFFASAWQKCCDDPTIIFPPPPCGGALGQALPPASRKTTESFGLLYPDADDLRFKQLPEESVSDRARPGAGLNDGEKRTEGTPISMRETAGSQTPRGRLGDGTTAAEVGQSASRMENLDR